MTMMNRDDSANEVVELVLMLSWDQLAALEVLSRQRNQTVGQFLRQAVFGVLRGGAKTIGSGGGGAEC